MIKMCDVYIHVLNGLCVFVDVFGAEVCFGVTGDPGPDGRGRGGVHALQ